jgi:hypothetical protein
MGWSKECIEDIQAQYDRIDLPNLCNEGQQTDNTHPCHMRCDHQLLTIDAIGDLN